VVGSPLTRMSETAVTTSHSAAWNMHTSELKETGGISSFPSVTPGPHRMGGGIKYLFFDLFLPDLGRGWGLFAFVWRSRPQPFA
jgi:hypothetical protein